jgi:hypothetical protein
MGRNAAGYPVRRPQRQPSAPKPSPLKPFLKPAEAARLQVLSRDRLPRVFFWGSTRPGLPLETGRVRGVAAGGQGRKKLPRVEVTVTCPKCGTALHGTLTGKGEGMNESFMVLRDGTIEYMEQERGRPAGDEPQRVTRTCEVCGTDISDRRQGTRTCSGKCMTALSRRRDEAIVPSGADVEAAVGPPLIIDESPRLILTEDAFDSIDERVALATERLRELESSRASSAIGRRSLRDTSARRRSGRCVVRPARCERPFVPPRGRSRGLSVAVAPRPSRLVLMS